MPGEPGHSQRVQGRGGSERTWAFERRWHDGELGIAELAITVRHELAGHGYRHVPVAGGSKSEPVPTTSLRRRPTRQ